MQPKTQQPLEEQQGLYRPAQAAPAVGYQTEGADTAGLEPAPTFDETEVVSWEASEYIHTSKDATWTIGFILVVLAVISVSVYFQAWTFTALAVVMALAMGVFAFRKPKIKQYKLTHQSIIIDNKPYHLSDFRSFGVLAEEAFFSIVLIPTKRFMPAVTLYFAEADGEKIVGILSDHLPLEDIQPDPIDIIMRRLHF